MAQGSPEDSCDRGHRAGIPFGGAGADADRIPAFELIETMRVVSSARDSCTRSAAHGVPDDVRDDDARRHAHYRVVFRDRHLARLKTAAGHWRFPFDAQRVDLAIDRALAWIAADAQQNIRQPLPVYRMRLTLDRHGTAASSAARLALLPQLLEERAAPDGLLALPSRPRAQRCRGGPVNPDWPASPDAACRSAPVDILVAADHGFAPVPRNACLSGFKTTSRDLYDQAWHQAEANGAFDMLFENDSGRVTEGGRSNLLVKVGGRWYTPPVTDGLLPGIMRGVLREDPRWAVTEREMRMREVLTAETVAVCNALRGVLSARIVRRDSGA